MSTARLSQRSLQPQQRVNLRALPSMGAARANRSAMVFLAFSVAAIAVLNLCIHIMTSNAVYELADLQAQKRELTTNAQILSEQVDSLSSQQNLADSAQKLGMIANANPVFLRISDQTVLGKPKAALDTSGRVASNLIPNAALTERTGDLSSMVASSGKAGAVAVAPETVVSYGSEISASPTR